MPSNLVERSDIVLLTQSDPCGPSSALTRLCGATYRTCHTLCRDARGGMHQDSCFTNSIADKPGSVANEVADLCHSLCFDNRAAMFPMQADTLTALRRSM